MQHFKHKLLENPSNALNGWFAQLAGPWAISSKVLATMFGGMGPMGVVVPWCKGAHECACASRWLVAIGHQGASMSSRNQF